MARHPFGLTSTVYPFACSVFPPSSHSTVNSTREFSRIPARMCFRRDSSANSSVHATVFSLRSTPIANQLRRSAQFQIQANSHTLLYNPTYPPHLAPSMELPFAFPQPVTSTLLSQPRSQAPHRVIPTGEPRLLRLGVEGPRHHLNLSTNLDGGSLFARSFFTSLLSPP
jgi:hypothetical protein